MNKKTILQLVLILLLFGACSSDNSIETANGDTDGGTSTSIVGATIATNTNKELNAVYFANETVGYIVGGDVTLNAANDTAIILKTTDGGVTWNSIYSDTGFYAISVYAASPTVAYVTTTANFILKTIDGGTTWERIEIATDDFFMSHINFSNTNTGYIVGSKNANGVLYKTIDAGNTWVDATESDTVLSGLLIDNQLTSIEFSSTNTILISGGLWNNGTILRSTDAGDTWNKNTISGNIKTTDVNIVGSLGFLVGNNGVINGSSELGELYKTIDNGETWNLVDTDFNNRISRLSYKGEAICIVGRNKANDLSNPEFLMLSKDNGNTWSRVEHDFVVAGWNDVTFISETKIIAVGYNGRSVLIEL